MHRQPDDDSDAQANVFRLPIRGKKLLNSVHNRGLREEVD